MSEPHKKENSELITLSDQAKIILYLVFLQDMTVNPTKEIQEIKIPLDAHRSVWQINLSQRYLDFLDQIASFIPDNGGLIKKLYDYTKDAADIGGDNKALILARLMMEFFLRDKDKLQLALDLGINIKNFDSRYKTPRSFKKRASKDQKDLIVDAPNEENFYTVEVPNKEKQRFYQDAATRFFAQYDIYFSQKAEQSTDHTYGYNSDDSRTESSSQQTQTASQHSEKDLTTATGRYTLLDRIAKNGTERIEEYTDLSHQAPLTPRSSEVVGSHASQDSLQGAMSTERKSSDARTVFLKDLQGKAEKEKEKEKEELSSDYDLQKISLEYILPNANRNAAQENTYKPERVATTPYSLSSITPLAPVSSKGAAISGDPKTPKTAPSPKDIITASSSSSIGYPLQGSLLQDSTRASFSPQEDSTRASFSPQEDSTSKKGQQEQQKKSIQPALIFAKDLYKPQKTSSKPKKSSKPGSRDSK